VVGSRYGRRVPVCGGIQSVALMVAQQVNEKDVALLFSQAGWLAHMNGIMPLSRSCHFLFSLHAGAFYMTLVLHSVAFVRKGEND